MQQKALKFPRGVMYSIICKANEYALTIQDKVNHKNSRVQGEFKNPQQISQLWFIDQIRNADFQIVNALSSFCLDEQKGELRLKKGKQKQDQLFSIQKVPIEGYYEWFWIKTQQNSDQAACLEGTLKYKKFNPQDQNQMFRFQLFVANKALDKTSIITNVASGKVLDVPGASSKQGEAIIQYSKNRRFNQRWVFEQVNGGVMIKNFNSKLPLDVSGQKKIEGTSVIQWLQNNEINQLWKFQQRGNNTFIIRSMLQPKLTLGILNNDMNDGGKLVIDKQQTVWHIEGRLPPYVA